MPTSLSFDRRGRIYTANPHDPQKQNFFMSFLTTKRMHLRQPGAKYYTPRFFRWPPKTQNVVWVRNTFRPQLRGTRIGPVVHSNVFVKRGGRPPNSIPRVEA